MLARSRARSCQWRTSWPGLPTRRSSSGWAISSWIRSIDGLSGSSGRSRTTGGRWSAIESRRASSTARWTPVTSGSRPGPSHRLLGDAHASVAQDRFDLALKGRVEGDRKRLAHKASTGIALEEVDLDCVRPGKHRQGLLKLAQPLEVGLAVGCRAKSDDHAPLARGLRGRRVVALGADGAVERWSRDIG